MISLTIFSRNSSRSELLDSSGSESSSITFLPEFFVIILNSSFSNDCSLSINFKFRSCFVMCTRLNSPSIRSEPISIIRFSLPLLQPIIREQKRLKLSQLDTFATLVCLNDSCYSADSFLAILRFVLCLWRCFSLLGLMNRVLSSVLTR